MSLINEALKRAETEKLRQADSADAEQAPAHIKRDFYAPPRKTPRFVPVLVVLAAASLAFGVWRAITGLRHAGPPASASAVVASHAHTATTRPTDPQSRPPTAPAAAPSPEIREIIDKTIAAVTYYQPPEPPPASAEIAAAPDPEPPTAAAAGRGQSPRPQAEPAPTPPQPKVDPASYKLSGILMGADGGTAIVNGRFLKVGQTVDEAKVVTITPNTVHLQVAGQVITIGL
ncbi:MAG TPA: hypothetical protein VNA25_18225 [Phycisphaerae bacterium]|nr:hypothetical protein [Phycisphaerae bacterium]